MLNATQKNLFFAAGTAAVAAAGPIGPIAVFGLIAQPALAATKFTKDRGIIAKVGQASLGAALSFVAIGVGGMMNPTFGPQTQVAEAPAAVEQVAPVAEVVEVEEKVEVSCSKQTPNGLATLPLCMIGQETVMVTPEFAANWNNTAPAPAAPAAPAAPNYEYSTSQAALNEMCAAGKQYFEDVVARRMTVEQGKSEVRSYSTYLSRNSPASKSELLAVGVGCSRLWKF